MRPLEKQNNATVNTLKATLILPLKSYKSDTAFNVCNDPDINARLLYTHLANILKGFISFFTNSGDLCKERLQQFHYHNFISDPGKKGS